MALLGYGKGGAVFHAPLIESTPGLRLCAVVTGDAQRRAAVRERHPHAETWRTAEELWEAADRYDVAVVATPNATHAPLARAALRAGLAVVVDKPFALSAAEGRDLVAEADRCGRPLTVYHNRRWDSDFLTLWRAVDEGTLGRVHRFESRFERWRPEPRRTWRESGSAAEGAGVLWDLGPHLVDQAVNLFGPVSGVYAELDAHRGASDDDAFLALRHSCGTRSHLWMGALAARPGPRFRVLGDRGGFISHGMDGQEERLLRGERPGAADWGEEPKSVWPSVGVADDLDTVPRERGTWPAFYAGLRDAVAEGEPLPVEPYEVIHGLEILEAARRSAEDGRVVPVGAQGEA